MNQELFFGGNIITFDGSSPEGVLVEGGQILRVFSKSELESFVQHSGGKLKKTNL